MVAKTTRDGRIVLWQGASLWAFDVLPANADRPNRMHAHHAFQLTLSAGGKVGIRTAEGLTPGPALLIAPDVQHAIEPEGRIALLFVEPESRVGLGFWELLKGKPVMRLPDTPGRNDDLARIWDRPPASDATLVELGRRVLDGLLGRADADAEPSVDPRIARVLDHLDHGSHSDLTAAEAAASPVFRKAVLAISSSSRWGCRSAPSCCGAD